MGIVIGRPEASPAFGCFLARIRFGSGIEEGKTMNKSWPMVKLGEVLWHTPRPVSVDCDASYRQIGIRSHGKGVFHKEAVSGFDLGKKKVFWMEPGDLVVNIVFGWEGSVALLGETESGMIASHRFPTFRANESRLDTRFLVQFFKTPGGLDRLGRVLPGGCPPDFTRLDLFGFRALIPGAVVALLISHG